MTLSYDVNLPRNMADWDLIGRFLYLDLLITDKLTLLNLQDQLTFDLILGTTNTWTLNLGCELLLVYHLVDFHTASIACIDCNLHARLDIAAPRDYAFDVDERADHVRLDVSHSLVLLLAILPAWYDDEVVLSFELGRDSISAHALTPQLLIVCSQITLVYHLGARLLIVEASLLHHNVKGGQVLIRKLHRWQRKIVIDYF